LFFYYEIIRETEPGWENEIEEEVGGECSKFGKILNIVVNKNSKVKISLKKKKKKKKRKKAHYSLNMINY